MKVLGVHDGHTATVKLMKMRKISIIMPAFNEERTIEKTVDKVEKIKIKNYLKELIIVDDCSKDNTSIIIKKLKMKYKNIKSFTHPVNQGKGATIRTALKNVTGEIAIIQDADAEYNPEEIADLIKFREKNKLDVVYGSRALNKNNSYSYISYLLGNVFLNKITNLLYSTRLTDMETCYKLVPSKILKQINIVSNGFDIEPEITAKIARLGYKIAEFPISYYPRSKEEGKKIRWKDGLAAVWTLFYWRFRKF